MKAAEIRDMTLEEMRRKAEELRQELFNLRFQHESGQLENPQRVKQAKRDIARILTVIRETESKSPTEKEK